MAETVYILCALTSVLCALLLGRKYAQTRTPLLLYASLCFGALAVNNTLVVVDAMVLKDVDLRLWRTGSALAGLLLMLYGLIWENE
ncbi:MAG: hypothetical protein H7Y88_13540 [Phycisphaerales bacterium]|nr:hypothetical protein [Phycisphaerales bacterium]